VQNNVTSLSISAKAESASARTQVLRADDVELEPSAGGFAELTASADKTVAFGGDTASFKVVVYAENTDSSKYTLTVSRVGGSLPLMATGGKGQIIEAPDGTLYEVHVFNSTGDLAFTDPATDSIVADYLIVAGGGGGGQPSSAGTDQGGGGGAGGLLYKIGQTLATNSPIAVTVGAGGGTNADGGYSYLGTIKVPGGGRGGKADNSGQIGGNGGSGGGDGSSTGTAEPTTVSSGKRDTASGGGGAYIYNDVLGYGGGLPANSGGGGGGAKGAGGNGVTNNRGGTGGAGWNPSSTEGATWIKDVTGTAEFSHGGWGGWYNNTATGAAAAAAANYGDGGNASATNKSGHSGIVVVRWPYVAPADN
jgi:hypothetical protein